MRVWESRLKNKSFNEGPAFSSWPRPLKDFFYARGFLQDDDLRNHLETDLQSLKNPFSLKGMQVACERLEKAFRDKERICIYADFDLDGTSGCALLKTAFDQLGFENVLAFQPKRLKDGYGFHAPIVEELKNQGVSVIVTCDVGITAHKACDRAKELGIDVILTDHHLPSGGLPQVHALINPNQEDDNSGLGYLSGAGVAFYLVRALKRRWSDIGFKQAEKLNLKELLDCFTIATITDMVPLIEDNRVLTQVGLKVLSQTKRPGLQALLQQLGLFGKQLTSADVAIRFAPKLNALSRLEKEILPLDIYLETDFSKALQVTQYVLEQNSARADLQSSAMLIAEFKLDEQKDRPFIFVHSEKFHRGVLGLIATALVEQTQKPCFVASLDPEELKMVGSCRLPESIDGSLVEALESASEHLLRYGGHAQAAGFELAESSREEFCKSLHEYYLSLKPKIARAYFDAVVDLQDLDWELVEALTRLEPFGSGFETPTFFVHNLQIKSFKSLKGRHLKLQLSSPSGREITALLFNPSVRQSHLIKSQSPIDCLVQVQINEWRGKKEIQLLVEDVREAVSDWKADVVQRDLS